MVTYADPKSKTTDPPPGVTVTQSSKGSGATIAYHHRGHRGRRRRLSAFL